MSVCIDSYNPFYFVRDLDTLFGDYYGNERQSKETPKKSQYWTPVVEMRETDEAFTIQTELPGIKKEDISIDLNGNTLTLSGERSNKAAEKNERIHRVERSYGKFTRSFTLPKSADTSNITAIHEDGVLELTIPKLAPTKPVVRKIEIQSSSSSSPSSLSTSTPISE